MPLRPDPTFYPSPASAIAAPAEELAYVVTLNTGTNGDRKPDALAVVDVNPASSDYGTVTGRARHAERRRRAPPLRLERLLARRSARGRPPPRRAPLLPDPGPALLAHPRRRREGRPAGAEACQAIEADELAKRTGSRGRTPCTAALTGSTSPRSARRRRRPRRRRAARPRQLQPARRLGGRPRPAAPGLRRLVEHRLRHRPHQRVGHAEHGRERHRRRAPAEQPVRPPPAHLGHAPPPQAGPRPRRRAPDGARAAAGPRPDEGRTGSSASSSRRGPVGQHLAVAARPAGRATVEKVITIPAEPADASQLPPLLQPFGAVPPLVTDIAL